MISRYSLIICPSQRVSLNNSHSGRDTRCHFYESKHERCYTQPMCRLIYFGFCRRAKHSAKMFASPLFVYHFADSSCNKFDDKIYPFHAPAHFAICASDSVTLPPPPREMRIALRSEWYAAKLRRKRKERGKSGNRERRLDETWPGGNLSLQS